MRLRRCNSGLHAFLLIPLLCVSTDDKEPETRQKRDTAVASNSLADTHTQTCGHERKESAKSDYRCSERRGMVAVFFPV